MSFFGIVHEGGEDTDPYYYGQGFYRREGQELSWMLDYTITLFSESLLRWVQDKYESEGWTRYHEQLLQFDEFAINSSSPAISLRITEPTNDEQKHWVVAFIRNFKFTKWIVDQITPKYHLPISRIGIKWVGPPGSIYSPCVCEFELLGMKGPHKYFKIFLPEEALSTDSGREASKHSLEHGSSVDESPARKKPNTVTVKTASSSKESDIGQPVDREAAPSISFTATPPGSVTTQDKLPEDNLVPSANFRKKAGPSNKNLSELLSVMETLKRQSHSLKFRLVKLIFTGTPRVGKSTLKKRIMEEITNLSKNPEVNPSTGLEKPCVVQVPLGDSEAERAAFFISHTSDESSHAWKDQDLPKQLSILFDSMLNEKVSFLKAHSGDKFISPQASKKNNDVASSPTDKTSPASPSSPAQSSSPSLLTDVGTIAQAIKWENTKEQLALIQETTSVYVMDTAGQPEFHEVLPFVLQGPALHLVFFSLLEDEEGTNCLDKQYEVEYVSKEGRSADPYKSIYPVKEVLFQLLASFHSRNKTEADSQHLANTSLDPSLHYSQAILIGTYKDKFIEGKHESQQKQCLNQVNQDLIVAFTGSNFYEESFLSTVPPKLQCAGTSTICGDRFYVAMDNMCGTKEEIDHFRNFLSRRISEVAQPVELPCSVLLFHLLLRYQYEAKPGICTIEECKELAKKCQITDADVTKVLKYLHITMGTILYYEDVPSLNNTVFCDPNVLLSQINQLIAVCFTCDPTMKTMANRTRESGIIEPKFQNYVCSSPQYKGVISNEQVIDFLVHYKLMVKIKHEKGVEKLFMPCLLLPKADMATITTDFLKHLSICPLLIHFDGNFVPLGQFTSLIVRLYLKQWNCGEPWKLAKKDRYCNQVTFMTDTLLSVRLTSRLQFIEVLVKNSHEVTQKELQIFCSRARQHIMEAVEETETGHSFDCGFYCPGSFGLGQIPHYAQAHNVKIMQCSRENECPESLLAIPAQDSIWLQEPQELSEPPKVEISMLPLTDPPTLPDFLESVATKIPAKWRSFGIALGVSKSCLDGFQQIYPTDPLQCYVEIFESWTNFPSVTPKWLTIIRALKCAYVAECSLAEELNQRLKSK